VNKLRNICLGKYTVISRKKNAGQNYDLKIENKPFARVQQFQYLGKTLTKQSFIQEDITSRLKPGNACCDSVHKLLSSSLLSKNIKINIYITINMHVVLYGCETWSLILGEGEGV